MLMKYNTWSFHLTYIAVVYGMNKIYSLKPISEQSQVQPIRLNVWIHVSRYQTRNPSIQSI